MKKISRICVYQFMEPFKLKPAELVWLSAHAEYNIITGKIASVSELIEALPFTISATSAWRYNNTLKKKRLLIFDAELNQYRLNNSFLEDYQKI